MEKNNQINWFKKHTDTALILGAFASSIFWMNGKFSDVAKDISELKTDIAVMKTVLLMKNIMPPELCKAAQPEEKKP